MEFSAEQDVAMILPFPQKRGGAQPRFINFEDVPEFFKKLQSLFPVRRTRGSRGLKSAPMSFSIPVIQFGSFEGSFVPTINDFDRLDERFRFASGTLDAMKRLYGDYSFAVFKLKPGRDVKVHPMAFAFDARDPKKIFFPTVHVHDGEWHASEHFDHTLYAQVPEDNLRGEIREANKAGNPTEVSERKMSINKDLRSSPASEAVVAAPVFRVKLRGNLENRDQIFSLS